MACLGLSPEEVKKRAQATTSKASKAGGKNK